MNEDSPGFADPLVPKGVRCSMLIAKVGGGPALRMPCCPNALRLERHSPTHKVTETEATQEFSICNPTPCWQACPYQNALQ
jgi:hypothetical protein